MHLDKVKGKENTKKDITWTDLIQYSEEEILACKEKIRKLRKSLNYFKKQASSGVQFSLKKDDRHAELS